MYWNYGCCIFVYILRAPEKRVVMSVWWHLPTEFCPARKWRHSSSPSETSRAHNYSDREQMIIFITDVHERIDYNEGVKFIIDDSL